METNREFVFIFGWYFTPMFFVYCFMALLDIVSWLHIDTQPLIEGWNLETHLQWLTPHNQILIGEIVTLLAFAIYTISWWLLAGFLTKEKDINQSNWV